MADRTATWPVSKDVPVRADNTGWSGSKQGAGRRVTLQGGRSGGRLYRSFLDFTPDMGPIGVLRKAELRVFTAAGGGANARVATRRLTEDMGSEGTSTSFTGDDATNPSNASNTFDKGISKTLSPVLDAMTAIDITPIVGQWLSTKQRWADATGVVRKGADKPVHGILMMAANESESSQAWVVHSGEAADVGLRPYLHVEYDLPNQKPDFISTISPSGTVLPGLPFTGEFGDPNGDRPEYIQVAVRKKNATGSDPAIWSQKFPFDPAWVESGGVWTWSVPNPGSAILLGEIDYEWRARGYDRGHPEDPSEWSHTGNDWESFRQSGTAPSVVPSPAGTRDTLAGYRFKGVWTVAAGERVVSYRIQLKRATDLWTSPLWDEAFIPLTDEEESLGHIWREYGGPNLDAGTYDWRLLVVDSLGVSSAWSASDSLTLNIGSEEDLDDGDDIPPNTTGYARERAKVRIVLRDNNGANRGPGTVTAIIENASTVGASVRYNEPGEFYFTLVATHPQVSACEPWQTHYALQQYRNGAWKDLSNGLLTDFEAGSDDVTIFGLDYLGILSRSIDPRIPPDGENPTRPSEGKYHDVTIGSIISDQLTQARTAPKSPIAFIFNGNIDALNTKVSIFSSFKYRLDFIRGLIESHKAGTGKRTRLRCRKDPSQADKWVWDVREVSGVDRDNLRLEYGSLLQNYRVIALGEDFATRAHGVGTEPNNVRPKYAAYPSDANMATDPIVNIFGNVQRAVGPFVDLSDSNDIKRRVKQARLEAAKVGKRISLHLRVHGVAPLDGYDLTDSVPIDIDRGVVDTDAYGSGYWTIWGLEWRLFPDGHDELTWVVSPRLDESPPDEDLIASDPIHNTPEWEIGAGPPPPEPQLMAMRYYLDIESGVIYEREPPDYYGWTEVGALPPPVGYPGNDAEPPAVTGFGATSVYQQQADGTDLPVIRATWVTLLEDDIIGYELEWQAGTYDTTTPETPVYVSPDFLTPQSLRVAKDQDFAVLQPVIGGRSYDVRIRGYDMEGLVGDWVYATEVVIVPDADAPVIPSIELAGGYKMLGAFWNRNSEPDLSHYGVRFRPVGDPDWRFIDTRSNHITISDLTPGDWEVQVRALDHSLNVQTSATDPTALGPEDTGYEEAGWSDPVPPVTVTLVGQADVVFDTVVADFMSTGTLSADQIIGGSLKVGGTGYTEGLRVYDSVGRPIGAWGDWGWIVADPTTTDPSRAIWATPQGEMKFSAAYDWDGTDPIEAGIATTIWTTAIGPDGINAEAITFGSAAGGSNRVLNAGLELQSFPTVDVSSEEWTLASEWDDLTANINLDVTSGDLKMASI